MADYDIPRNLRYSREDEWARFFDDTPINAAEEEQLDRASPRATGEVYPLHASRF